VKILLAHVEGKPTSGAWYRDLAAAAGPELELRPFCVTLNPPGPRLAWPELDRRWRRRDRALLELYDRLQAAADACDVLLLYNGANLHPELLPLLPTFNVYCCFDDPESSEDLSRPLAPAFDAVFHGNIAARFQYEHWGCRKLAWIPNLNPPMDLPRRDDVDALLAAERDVEVAFVGERESRWRRARLDALTAAFPQARCHGSGWGTQRLSDAGLHELYRRARIGWNVHNSTGPINRRLFVLAAFGVLQICDNKTGLAPIFRLGEEVVGFDTIPEAIELTRHYLAHPEEARAIARRGCERFWREYHPQAIWARVHDQLRAWGAERKRGPGALPALPRRDASTLARVALDGVRPWLRRARRAAAHVRAEPDARLQQATPFDDRCYRGEDVPAYRENPGKPGVNLASTRLAEKGFLDWPDMLALNWAVTALIGPARRIVEIGSGTGPFAEFAARDPAREIHCFESDPFARARAVEQRSFPNVRYFDGERSSPAGRYDLLVSVEVIEHVDEVREFLDRCAQLAPRAIYTTPNRERKHGRDHFGPPLYPPHVREFTPGELFWMLRLYYGSVRLFHLPDPHVPWLAPMTIATPGTPIIAECRDPLASLAAHAGVRPEVARLAEQALRALSRETEEREAGASSEAAPARRRA
jgi:hypothetical protein